MKNSLLNINFILKTLIPFVFNILIEINLSASTKIEFIFCSLENNNGCSGMALARSNEFPDNKPYFFATSHTEQGIHTLEQLRIATNVTNKICTFSKIDFGLNPCNLGHFGINHYFNYERSWNSGDFIAGESDGSIEPFLAFEDGTNLEVKVYLASHGSSEFTPTFYEPKNPDQRYYKICLKDWGKSSPLHGRRIHGFININNQKKYFINKEQLINTLKNYGFTISPIDPDPSLLFVSATENCP